MSFKRDVYRRVRKSLQVLPWRFRITPRYKARLLIDVRECCHAYAHSPARNSRCGTVRRARNEALEYSGHGYLSCDGYRGFVSVYPPIMTDVPLLPDGDGKLKNRVVEPLRLRLMRDRRSAGRLAEPINLADAQKHPALNTSPSVKRERFSRVSACRSFSVANFSACWSYASANCFQYEKAKSLSSSRRSLRRWRLSCHSRRSQRCSGNTGDKRALPAAPGVVAIATAPA